MRSRVFFFLHILGPLLLARVGWANEPLLLSDSGRIAELTVEEPPIVQVNGGEVVLLHADALKRDFPILGAYSPELLRQEIEHCFSVITKQQLRLIGIRNTEIPRSEDKDDRWLNVFSYNGRGGLLSATVNYGSLIMADLKGSGLVAAPERIELELAQWKDAKTDLQRDEFQIRGHSDGLMSLGEAIAEDFRQRALQGIFERLDPGQSQTVESYAVIRLPFRILKGGGRSVPAAIYARQPHLGRLVGSPSRRSQRFYFDYYGHGQTTFSGSAVDFGGVILKHPAFDSWFRDVESRLPTVDPQKTWIWARSHQIADLLAGNAAQKIAGQKALVELENDLQVRLQSIGPVPKFSQKERQLSLPTLPSEEALQKSSDAEKIKHFYAWEKAGFSVAVSPETYTQWPVDVREAYIRTRFVPKYYGLDFVRWIQSETDPRLRILAARKLDLTALLAFIQIVGERARISTKDLLAASLGIDLKKLAAAIPYFQNLHPTLHSEVMRGDPSTLLLALQSDTPVIWNSDDLWSLYFRVQEPLVRLAILSRVELRSDLVARRDLQWVALQLMRQIAQGADQDPRHPDWALLQENQSGADPAFLWMMPILSVLPASDWVTDPLLQPESWVNRVEAFALQDRPLAPLVTRALTTFQPVQEAFARRIRAGKSPALVREWFFRNRGLVLLDSSSPLPDIPIVQEAYQGLLHSLEEQRREALVKMDSLAEWGKSRKFLMFYEVNLQVLASLGEWIRQYNPQAEYFLSTPENKLRLARLALPGAVFETGDGRLLLEKAQDTCKAALLPNR